MQQAGKLLVVARAQEHTSAYRTGICPAGLRPPGEQHLMRIRHGRTGGMFWRDALREEKQGPSLSRTISFRLLSQRSFAITQLEPRLLSCASVIPAGRSRSCPSPPSMRANFDIDSALASVTNGPGMAWPLTHPSLPRELIFATCASGLDIACRHQQGKYQANSSRAACGCKL